MRYPRLASLVILLFTACSDAAGPVSRVVEGVDLDRLFAVPSQSEIAGVRSEWAVRDVSPAGYRVETSASFLLGSTTGRVRVVSHVVGGFRHYGAIAVPDNATPGSLPVLVYCHGGDGGVNVDELLLLTLLLGDAADNYVYVVPSFRSETLAFAGQSFRSEGDPSPWDRDVDDALALIGVTLENEAAADPDRVAVVGFSRGAGVALLMGARDPRIDAVVEFFGPTDFFDPWVQDLAAEALRGNPRDLPGLAWLDERFLQPLRRGETPLDAVRKELLRRSAVLFASSFPAVQVHHGTADSVVAFSQAESLDRAMRSLSRSAPDYEYYAYPGGGHNPLGLPESAARAASFLARFANTVPVL